jgi:hypothetical protein
MHLPAGPQVSAKLLEHNMNPIDDSDRLKPCPFCGGDAMFTVEERDGHPDFGGHSAMCGSCGAGIGYVFACMDDPKPLLMELWNKRPLPDARTSPRTTHEDGTAHG